MGEVAVRIEGLGKRYRIGGQAARSTSLRETATRAAVAPWRRAVAAWRGEATVGEEFWALRDVSLEVPRGEAVGIVGRNGAGKTTLLKILSRITLPTEGQAEIHGRVGSLLEVGTGFHPELTGGENVFLNGAILGMRRAEIRRRYDEIVEFAELPRFIDTPVKHYSSGMYVRLAFAVAAHLQPEILIVDEVLAVGDAAFQQKCLGRMSDVTREGRTVLFVSHNMTAVQNLTARAVLLDGGRVVDDGHSPQVVARYLSAVHRAGEDEGDLTGWPDRQGTGRARVTRLEVLDARGEPARAVTFREPVTFRLTCEFSEPSEASFGVLVHSLMHEPLVDLRSTNGGLAARRERGLVVLEARVERLPLYPGEYLLSPWIADRMVREDVDFVHFAARLHVAAPAGETRARTLDPSWGKLVVDSDWRYLS